MRTGEYTIQAGEYAAVVRAQAGALRELRHQGRDLIVPSPVGGLIPDYRGIIAAAQPDPRRQVHLRERGLRSARQ